MERNRHLQACDLILPEGHIQNGSNNSALEVLFSCADISRSSRWPGHIQVTLLQTSGVRWDESYLEFLRTDCVWEESEHCTKPSLGQTWDIIFQVDQQEKGKDVQCQCRLFALMTYFYLLQSLHDISSNSNCSTGPVLVIQGRYWVHL